MLLPRPAALDPESPLPLPTGTRQAALTQAGAGGKAWHLHVAARHSVNASGACRGGVYWARAAVPSEGELTGRVTLKGSDTTYADDVTLAAPSVAVAAGGAAWVGFEMWGASHPAGERGSL